MVQNGGETLSVKYDDLLQALPGIMAGTSVEGIENTDQLDRAVLNIGFSSFHVSDEEHEFTAVGWRFEPIYDAPALLMPFGFNSRNAYKYMRQGSKPPSVALLPKSYLGKIVDIGLTVVDTPMRTEEGGAAAMIVSARLKSSGLAATKPFHTLVKTEVSLERAGLRTEYHKYGKSMSPEQIAMDALASSSERAREVYVQRLRHAYSGGLPGTSRRSHS